MLDKLTNKLSHDIRGLNEVQTDEQGKKLIAEAVKSIREVYKHQNRYIAELEQDNMQMGLKMEHDERIKREHYLLVGALKNTIALDEIENKING